MEARRRKFEKLPAFLKAGVYYTTKHEATRKMEFYPRLFAFELIMKAGNAEFHMGEHSGACRKYEEAYSLWHYFGSDNPNWNTEGIDDSQLTETDTKGKNQKQN